MIGSGDLRRLLVCQWGAVVAVGLGAAAIGVQAWGAWLPALAWLVGTATWVWRLAPDPALRDRAALRALAAGAGLRSGVLVAGLAVLGLPGPEAGGPGGGTARVVVALLVGGAAVLALTLLSLIGLDAGRADALRRAPVADVTGRAE